MPVVTPPTLTLPGLSPDRSDRATFTARSIARDEYIKNVQVPQLILALANVAANATDTASSATTGAAQAVIAVDASNAASISTLSSLTRSQSAAASLFSIQNLTNQFNVTYLGAKSADPTLDNSGAPLISGAFYTSTTTNTIRTYTGTAWVQGVSVTAGVASVNGVAGAVTNIATTGANIFTGPQNDATGAAIASAATVNLDTATGNRVHVTGVTAITAVTLTRGPRTLIFDGVLILTHNATTNNLPGAANITTAAGDRAIYESDGVTVYCVSYVKASGFAVIGSVGDHEIALHTGNGHGTTNTAIRRFTTALTSTGTAITYADSAALGATLTISETGLYAIYYSDSAASAGQSPGVSVNSTQLTIALSGITVANRLAMATVTLGGTVASLSRTVRLVAGDVLRPHTGGAMTDGQNTTFFAIRKVGI